MLTLDHKQTKLLELLISYIEDKEHDDFNEICKDKGLSCADVLFGKDEISSHIYYIASMLRHELSHE